MRKAASLMAAAVATAGVIVSAQMLTGEALVAALRGGGHVIVMRHAQSPGGTPSKADADPRNSGLERELDETGRSSARAFGEALRRLKIPVGEALTSPTFRARETARLAGFAEAMPHEELGDGGQSMKGATGGQRDWLRRKAAERPRSGNAILVTHSPNIASAFPDIGTVQEGEAVVVRPDGAGGAQVVGRVRIEEWPALR
jgi:phosphohistidine phosphatase SixA